MDRKIEFFDWNKLWKESEQASHENSDEKFWDGFAENFRKKLEYDEYVEKFYEKCRLEKSDTVFDMGCGPGTLAIPFAKKGHEVICADFSEGMLNKLVKDAKEEGVEKLIHPIKLDWNEDWSLRTLPVCDIAVSSRSLICNDLTKALKDLESVAEKRVALGVWNDPSRYYDRKLAEIIGYERPGYSCCYYVMNELMDRDVLPELSYISMITPSRKNRFASFEDAYVKSRSSFKRKLSQKQEEMLKEYAKEHIKMFEDKKGKYWAYDHERKSEVAFISWELK